MFNCSIPLNYESLLEIDVNYGGTPSWKALSVGVKNIAPALNESVDQASYYDGQGFAESHVVGAQYVLAVTLDRIKGDAAQDYILAKQFDLGCSRASQARYTNFQGDTKTGIVTIANITPPGGDAPAKGEWSFELHFKAKPVLAPATSAPALTATVVAGSVLGATSFTASAGVGNSLGYVLTNGVPTAPNAGSFVQALAYTSGANIAAVAGQSLNMFELDANKRVVLFKTAVLSGSEIGA